MKSFKTLREDALKKIKVGKVFEPTSSDDNKKDPAFSKKGKVATGDEGQLKYGSKNNDVHVTEEVDLDQKYADWQDEVKQRNPQHAAKIKFKTNPDQRDTISAEHGDRSFGTFNTKTGEAIHLGEATEGNKFESEYDVVAHLAKAGYRGIQAKDVELYQGGRATARHRGSSASQHYGKYFSVNSAGDVKVHGDGASAAKAMKEEVELDEAVKLGSKVSIHAPGKSYHGKTGIVGEVRHGLYKGAPKTYTVDYDHNEETGRAKSIQLDKKNIKSFKEEVELDESWMSQRSSYDGPGKGKLLGNMSEKEHVDAINYHGNQIHQLKTGTHKYSKMYTKQQAADKLAQHMKHYIDHKDAYDAHTMKEEAELSEGTLMVSRHRSYARPGQGSEAHPITKDHGTASDGSRVYSVKQPNGFHGVLAVKGDTVVGSSQNNLSKDEAHKMGDHYVKHGTVVSTKISDVGINEDYKEKNYEYKNKDGRTATLSCATYSDGDAEHFVHIKGQRATRHSTKEKAHQSLRVRGYEPTGKVEEE